MIYQDLSSQVFDRIINLPPYQKDRLISKIQAYSAKMKFFFKNKIFAQPQYHPIALNPIIISPRCRRELITLGKAVNKFQAQLPELYQNRVGDLGDLFALGRGTKKWFTKYFQRTKNAYNYLIRIDVGLTKDATSNECPIVFEINGVGTTGLYNQFVGAQILERIILPKLLTVSENKALKRNVSPLVLFKRLIDHRMNTHHPNKKASLGFVEYFGLPWFSEIDNIAHYFSNNGYNVSYGEPEDLLYIKDTVYLHNRRIDMVIRDACYDDMVDSTCEYKGFTHLLRHDLVFPNFSSDLDSKGSLELLSSEKYQPLFSVKEREIFRRSVPWTRVIREMKTEYEGKEIDLLEFVRSNRDRLVIKPNCRGGGERVMLGKKVEQARWEQRIELAIQQKLKWVVQCYARTETNPTVILRNGGLEERKCAFVIGVFCIGREIGFYGRVNNSEIVNISRNGALSEIYVGG